MAQSLPSRKLAPPKTSAGKRQDATASTKPVADGGIQSIVRAFSILETIARSSEGIGLAELSRSVGLHTSTAFNLLRTMVSLEYVQQSPEDKRYRIGRPVLCLAASAFDAVFLVNRAKEILKELSAATGETAHFAVWAAGHVSVLAKSSGPGAFQLTDNFGVARPAHATALGKILLSALGERELERYFESATLTRLTPRTITDARQLRAEVARIRTSKFAFDDGEFHAEVRCIAVPVKNFADNVVGVMGLSGPIWRMTDRLVQEHGEHLRQASLRLSAEFGNGGINAEYSPASQQLGLAAADSPTQTIQQSGTRSTTIPAKQVPRRNSVRS